MKLAMQMTVEGMIRALRMKAHEAGDDPGEARRRAERHNEEALLLLSAEVRGLSKEVGDEFGR